MNFAVTVLGSGTSTGVPLIGCNCETCISANKKDKRLRASLLLQNQDSTLVIDTGPDFRYQMLRENINSLDAVLLTHYHYDHLGGLDDLRPFAFLNVDPLPCYVNRDSLEKIKVKYPYLFNEDYIKQKKIARLNFIELELAGKSPLLEKFTFKNWEIQPIELLHEPWSAMKSIGYVINKKFGYLTDFKSIYEPYKKYLYNLDVLYLGAPLPKQHNSHISMQEGLAIIEELDPQESYIGHLSHSKTHIELENFLTPAQPAYDGLTIKIV